MSAAAWAAVEVRLRAEPRTTAETLTEGHWGRSARLRWVGTVLRWTLAFGWVRPLIRTVAARRR